MKSDADEKELLKSVEHGEWRSAGGGKRERYRQRHRTQPLQCAQPPTGQLSTDR